MKKTMSEINDFTNKNVWEGYIWMVEDKEPKIINGKTIDLTTMNKTGNSFNRIMESNLYCNNTKQSIHIKNIDGTEYCYVFDLQEISKIGSLEFDKEEIIVPGSKTLLKNLKFIQLNQLTESLISGNDFTTWQPVCKIFIGFSN